MATQVEQRKFKVMAQAVVFGLVFGFLLQKGGVAKYHVLVGQLLLTDFTVVKLMLTAIFVAMIGLYFLRKSSMIKFHIKPTKVVSNIVGGLIFGIGFAFAGYCPGTGAAALGQGDLLALIFMAGLVAGSYLFAEGSGLFKRTIETLGDKGKITLHTTLRVNTGVSVALAASVILGALILLDWLKL